MQSQKTKIITYNALLAAVYIVLTLISPFSFGMINFRVSDVIQVVACLDKRARIGISLGMIIANLFSPYGIIDVLTAIVICIISFYFGWRIKSEKIRVGLLILTVSTAVATEICLLDNVPFGAILAAMIVSETIMCSVGYAIMKKLA